MAKTADEFLNDLATRDLAPAEIIDSLRRQVAKSPTPVAAASIAKLLTDKGHLTASQVQKLLGTSVPAAAAAKPVTKPLAASSADDGGLLPLDLDALAPLGGNELMPLDDGGLMPLEELTAPLQKPAAATKTQPPAKPKPSVQKQAPVSSQSALAPLDDLTQPAMPVAGAADLLAAAPAAHSAVQAAAQPAKKKSSLGLVLGLIAALLVGGGGAAAFFLVPRGTGDAEFDLAAADYQAKSYDAAVAKLEAALAKYPASPRAPLARVQRGAAKVLAARAQSPRDWQPVLSAAKESLPPIGGEAELSAVHPELAPLLMEMAAALSKSKGDAAAAREALVLADDGRFVPGSLRDWQKLAGAAEALARVAHDAAYAQARDAAVATMMKAIDAGDVAAALAERERLRTSSPGLLEEAALSELGPSLAAAAATKVQPAEYAVKGETTESRGAIVGQLVLRASPHTEGPTSQTGGPTKVFVSEGTAWARTHNGPPRWRRPIGSGPAALPVPSESGKLLVDAYRNELLSVDATSGALRWRHPLPGPAAGPPVVVGPRVFVTTKAGQVLALDATTGNGIASVQLPQTAATGPATAGEFLVQVADDALVYVLASADLKCRSAAYLGHEPASVTQPPAAASKLVVVATTRWPAATVLRPIVVNAKGELGESAPATEVTGLLSGPLVVEAGKLIVTTDQGRATTFESAADPADGLKQVAVIDVKPDIAASTVLPLAGVVAGASADTVTVIATTGATTEIKLAGLTGLVVRDISPAAKDVPAEMSIASVLALPGSGALLVPSGQAAELRVLDPNATTTRSLPLPGPLAALPLVWNKGIAVACSSGTIAWIDPATGALKADPLQINLLPGERLANCRLVAGGKGEEELFVAHSGGAILRVGLATDPQSQLVELAAAKIEAAITGLAASDEAVGVLDRRGQWHTFTLPDLSPAPAATLAGRSIVVGPARIGSAQLVATDSDELIALNDQLQTTWKVPLAHGPLAGVPVADSTGPLLASSSGWLYRIALDSGNEVAAVNLAQPLASAPLVIGQFALVPAADGTLLKVSLAALEAPQP
jgi:outer membrane protein assembly factor BamB